MALVTPFKRDTDLPEPLAAAWVFGGPPLVLLTTGVLQWRTFRALSRWAAVWLPVPLLSFYGGYAAATVVHGHVAVNQALRELVGGPAALHVLTMAVLGGMYGAVSGLVVSVLLRTRRRHAALAEQPTGARPARDQQ